MGLWCGYLGRGSNTLSRQRVWALGDEWRDGLVMAKIGRRFTYELYMTADVC